MAADGKQSQDYLFDPATPVGSRVSVPIDLGGANDQVFLQLYATGFRNASSAKAFTGDTTLPVSAFAAVGAYQGLDVINIGPLPRSLAGRGGIGIAITIDGMLTNTVTVSIH